MEAEVICVSVSEAFSKKIGVPCSAVKTQSR